MPARKLYPEGSKQMNVFVPAPVKDTLQIIASRRRVSASQLVTGILSRWLEEQGHLPVAARGGDGTKQEAAV